MNITPFINKIKPNTRAKGYANYASLQSSNLKSSEIFDLIKSCYKTDNYFSLVTKDREIFDRIISSYEKISKNEILNQYDFALSGHELSEMNMLTSDKIPRYVVYRYKYNKYPELKIRDHYPPCIQIEPTSICNYRCVMCYQIDKSFSTKSQGHMGYMSLDTFKAAIDELEGNIEAITFASRGEPLLHPRLSEMLKYAKGKFLALKLNTNGSLLTEQMCHDLLTSDLQTLVFSVDAAEPTIYEKIRVNGNFEKVHKNIKMFSEIRKTFFPNSKLILKISGVKLNEEQNFDSMTSFWGELVDEVGFSYYNPWESAYDNCENNLLRPCTELWRRCFIWWDGKVNPCDFDYKSTLSIHENQRFPQKSIKEIWSSKFYEQLRANHLNAKRKDLEPCKRCVSI